MVMLAVLAGTDGRTAVISTKKTSAKKQSEIHRKYEIRDPLLY